MLTVWECHEATPEILEAFERLMPQLSPDHRAPSMEMLKEMIGDPGLKLLMAGDPHEKGGIAGTLSLVLFGIPTGLHARIEDVVVDQVWRGQGIGRLLVQEALRLVSETGARGVDLTSRPAREAANRLYQRIGFKKHDTNVYRYLF
jgi:ribosomal protein S18 acetylase RimI-like enzyme